MKKIKQTERHTDRQTHAHADIVFMSINQICSTTSVFIMLLLILCVVSSIFRNASIGDEWLLVWTTNKAIAMQNLKSFNSGFFLLLRFHHRILIERTSSMNNEQHFLGFCLIVWLKLIFRCRFHGQYDENEKWNVIALLFHSYCSDQG